MNGGANFISHTRDILITGICAYYVINGEMSIGIMMTLSYIAGRLSSPLSNLILFRTTIQDVTISYERLDEIINNPDTKKSTHLPCKYKSVIVSNVWFKYPGSNSPYILKGISVVLQKGRTTAIVGSSGSGKTTLLKLLSLFYSPSQGSIMLDNCNLAEVPSEEWLRISGIVNQDGYIFSGSIAENIALSDENPDINRIITALHVACLDNLLSKLPMGVHTKIGSTGLDLSGGEKQRLMIARAVYKNPEFIFLDEATSSLDANTEKEIVTRLKAHFSSKTVVIVAHRLSTIRHADVILFIHDGMIIEQGNHDELISIKGNYYSLLHNQLS